MQMVSIEVPDDKSLAIRPDISTLPVDWADLPTSVSAQEFGRQWQVSEAHLILYVLASKLMRLHSAFWTGHLDC